MTTFILEPPTSTRQATARADDPGARYWARLREPDALVRRDLALIRALRPATPVLDVGCGNGGFLGAAARNGIASLGIEAFEESARLAAGSGAVLRASGDHLPLADGAFDVVRLKEVLEHVQQPLAMAREMLRALAPGGTFLCYVPTQWSQLYPFPANFYDDYTHVRAFSRVGLARLLEDAGFERVQIAGYTPPLRSWQRPVGAIASRVFPFLWRATAVRPAGGARGR